MSDLQYEEPKASKLPIAALTLRVTTLITLVISLVLLKPNSVTYDKGGNPETFAFKDVPAYKYVFFGTIVGLSYFMLMLPFDLYFFFRKKRLINNSAFLMFEFYGNKVCMILLTTAVGALFGATAQTNAGAQKIKFFGGSGQEYDAEDYRSKMREYCMVANISGVLLLIGCFCSVLSSFISSRALANKW